MYPPAKKIINDPVYGFITIPSGLIFQLIEHPWFQRLRRIKQLGLTHYVYPGALHTRFHHALGAFHLMTQAIEVLRSKGIEISQEEAEAVQIAILLHDIGHGPFSHALEHMISELHHESLSLIFMKELDIEFKGKLGMAIRIFQNAHEKPFLYQLVSSQLDMDRMDYLTRDSFFTGVSEGVVGYDRIIKMLAVADGHLVVEEKGLFSIEKFLVARRLMYWQVYLHKTVLSAEQMLIKALLRAKFLAGNGVRLPASKALSFFLYPEAHPEADLSNPVTLIKAFALLDDFDVVSALKEWVNSEDTTLSFLSKRLINRKLFKIRMSNSPVPSDFLSELRLNVSSVYPGQDLEEEYIVFTGSETNSNYTANKDEIQVLFKDGRVRPVSECADLGIVPREIVKYFLCMPGELLENK